MKDGIYLMEMGKKIRAARRSKGIGLRKMITLCKLHKSSLSEIETGKRDCHILTLKLIADTLGVDIKEFI